MCMIGDAETVTVFHCKQQTARKEHRCDECGRPIAAGEAYENQRYLVETAVYTHKTCSHCQVPRSWLTKNCDGYIYGRVGDDIAEHVHEYPDLAAPLGFFVQGMRGRWTHDGVLMPLPDQAPPITVAEPAVTNAVLAAVGQVYGVPYNPLTSAEKT